MAAGKKDEAQRKTQRGVSHPQKQHRRHKFSRNIRRSRDQRRRRQARNRQIWEELRTTALRSATTETQTVQPTTTQGEAGVRQASGTSTSERQPRQSWIAVGARSTNCASRNARSVTDGVLLKLAVSIAGRELVALIDSGASRCYISPEAVSNLGLQTTSVLVHLELADGSKIRSTQQAQDVRCTVGQNICQLNFTVTKLLHDVDLVLGADWLEIWNPVIDWQQYMVNIWTGQCWNQLQGLMLNTEQRIGTVKVFDPQMTAADEIPDFEDLRQPKFWTYTASDNVWTHYSQGGVNDTQARTAHDVQGETNSLHSFDSSLIEQAAQRTVQRNRVAKTVQTKVTSKLAGQRQLVSAKQISKLAKKGEQCYLVMIRPTQSKPTGQLVQQGMTQKVKRALMKERGAVRKPPPIADTRQKICSEAPAGIRDELKALLEEFADVFPEQLPKGQPPKREVEFEIQIESGAVPPSRPPYRLSPKEHEELQAQIEDLLAQGHIRPSQSPYGAPVLFVPKKDGRWRMCIDYRALNKQTIKDKYPLPRIDDLLDRLGQARHFSALDLASGYHQIAVKEEDIYKTAFRTQRGQFEFLVMPFGLANAPAAFQRLMNQTFKNELDVFVLVYLDDILIFSRTLEDHIQHIRVALGRLRDAKLYGRLHKSEFFKQKVEYLGFDVSPKGVQPSPDKVKAIVEWSPLQSVKDVRSFLGLAGFYRRFIRNFSQKARPLTDLTRAKVQWTWGDPEEQAFRELKRSLVTAPVLHMPDFDREFVLTTDASLVSVGAILEQDFGHGLQPVAFESRKLSSAEIRYSAYERELLGIVWAIGKWRHYFEGRHLIVQTDHSSIRHLPNQPSVNRRIWKWVSILQGYDLEIRHIPGRVNPADTLTRQSWVDDRGQAERVRELDRTMVEKMRVPGTASDQDIQQRLRELYSAERDKREQAQDQISDVQQSAETFAILSVYESRVQVDQGFRDLLWQEILQDEDYIDIIQELQDPDQTNEVARQQSVYRIRNGILKIHEQKQDLKCQYWRIVVPANQDLKLKILKELHCVPYSGHPGYARTLEVAKQSFYWRHMYQDVRDFVTDCPVCQQEKSSHLKPAGPLMPLQIPNRKWDHVAIDFVTGLPEVDEMNTILTVVDKATKMCHFIPCSDRITGKSTAKLYWQHVGRLHGIPSAIILDRDPRFTGRFWRELWRLLGTDLRMGSGYHPESSGQVEKFNQLLEQTLRCTIHQYGEMRRWPDILPVIEFAVNQTPNRTTGYSAFYLNYGYHPLSPAQMLGHPTDSSNEAVQEFTSRLQKDFDRALGQLTRVAE